MSLSDFFTELFLYLICVLICTACIVLGWFLVWKCFLKRFKFVQELLDNDEEKYKKDHLFEKAFQHNRPIDEILESSSLSQSVNSNKSIVCSNSTSEIKVGQLQAQQQSQPEPELQPQFIETRKSEEKIDSESDFSSSSSYENSEEEQSCEAPIIETGIRVKEICIERPQSYRSSILSSTSVTSAAVATRVEKEKLVQIENSSNSFEETRSRSSSKSSSISRSSSKSVSRSAAEEGEVEEVEDVEQDIDDQYSQQTSESELETEFETETESDQSSKSNSKLEADLVPEITVNLSDKENFNFQGQEEVAEEVSFFKKQEVRRPSTTELESSIRLRKTDREKKND